MKNFIKSALVVGSAVGAIALATPAQSQVIAPDCLEENHFIAQGRGSVLCYDDGSTVAEDGDSFYLLTHHQNSTSIATLQVHNNGGVSMGLTEVGYEGSWIRVIYRGQTRDSGSELMYYLYEDDLQLLIAAIAEISASGGIDNLSFSAL